ncbi:MAG: SAM-dependent methyltransferase, partial [Gammaproteobacteria bacterium]
LYARGVWQPGWPAPPDGLSLRGVDSRAGHVAVAREVLGGRAELRTEDLTTYRPPPCEAVTLLDVLFYMSPDAQAALIARVHAALEPGGLLLIREPDAGAGARFTVTRLAEGLFGLCRGRFKQRYHYRSAAQWVRLLEENGFTAERRPMSAGTPFANVLIEARKR